MTLFEVWTIVVGKGERPVGKRVKKKLPSSRRALGPSLRPHIPKTVALVCYFPGKTALHHPGKAMNSSGIRVPVSVEVSVSEVLQGLFDIEGMLSYADALITFSYQTKGATGKPSEEETFELPLEALRAVALKGGKLALRPRRLATLDEVPWTSGEAIIFKVKRKHREQAAALVDELEQGLAEKGLDDAGCIPFQLPDANLGFTEIKGLLYLEDAYLVFEVGTGISGGAKKKRHTIKIELRALTAIRFEPGAFRDHLFVRPKKRDLFRAMPGMYRDKDELKLILKKKHRDEAEDLVEAARMGIQRA